MCGQAGKIEVPSNYLNEKVIQVPWNCQKKAFRPTFLKRLWSKFWLNFSGTSFLGRNAARLASIGVPPYMGRAFLANLHHKGFIAPSATIHHPLLSLGRHSCISDRATIFQAPAGAEIFVEDNVFIHSDSMLQTGEGGVIKIGSRTHIHPRCIISSYLEPIIIGNNVLLAPNCALYSYDHGTSINMDIWKQPKKSNGRIVIGHGSWIGTGSTVLSGVEIGTGAVLGAGSVATRNIPDYAIAVGNPARVIRRRS